MEITRYIFQSPYSSPVQVGRADSSSKTESPTQDTSGLSTAVNQTANEAASFQETQVQEVEPTVSTQSDAPLLDTYA